MFTTAMHCSSIISELLPYSNAFFFRPLRLSGNDLPALRIPISTEGCGEAGALRSIGRF